MGAHKVGDPMDLATEIGPLATAQGVNDLSKQVETAIAAGGCAKIGGKKIPGPGNYYEPTVLTGIAKESPVFYEELFWPGRHASFGYVMPRRQSALQTTLPSASVRASGPTIRWNSLVSSMK